MSVFHSGFGTALVHSELHSNRNEGAQIVLPLGASWVFKEVQMLNRNFENLHFAHKLPNFLCDSSPYFLLMALYKDLALLHVHFCIRRKKASQHSQLC